MDPQNPAPGTWCCEDSRLHHNPGTMWNNLAGFTGLLVRGYLPQRWVFETGQERASLIVDVNGNTEVALGVVESADVLITTTHGTDPWRSAGPKPVLLHYSMQDFRQKSRKFRQKCQAARSGRPEQCQAPE